MPLALTIIVVSFGALFFFAHLAWAIYSVRFYTARDDKLEAAGKVVPGFAGLLLAAISALEIVAGAIGASGSIVVEGGSIGVASPVALPALAISTGAMVDGGRGILKAFKPLDYHPSESSGAERKGPASENWRGRYYSDRRARRLTEMPDDWDVHHRIPREYVNHREFANFDFHDPANLQGVEGVTANKTRGVPNTHQRITNDWAAFRAKNPSASRAQTEGFAREMDVKYAERFWK